MLSYPTKSSPLTSNKNPDLMHSVVVLPVYLLRAYAILAQYGASVILGSDVRWDEVIEHVEKELINDKYRQTQSTSVSTETSIALAENTANFIAAEIILVFNYGINVFDSASVIVGGDKNPSQAQPRCYPC